MTEPSEDNRTHCKKLSGSQMDYSVQLWALLFKKGINHSRQVMTAVTIIAKQNTTHSVNLESKNCCYKGEKTSRENNIATDYMKSRSLVSYSCASRMDFLVSKKV
ncbi:hypothetical protein DV515_00005779 [Chloebia gouldiae]|uniref:Uncharacterized protein n=1 Tax=Chloebia gouldiae TaxID=44316 RepID=A0A3L8SN82_CHLGU|nr:hypothetical protein DV515_00005779 [Chloebia gouldiae]